MIKLLFTLFMGGIMPVRKRGWFGTPDRPLYYEDGEIVPWWIECKWPLNIDVTFGSDIETYYEDGHQIVRPLYKDSTILIHIDGKGHSVHLYGAPTLLILKPRGRPRAPQLKLLEAL